jgi:type II secretory ATPase GspE/PulE/Tfp pilus assembly ATPase PilB-like protein
MEVDRYLVAATLRLSVAQRLCRKLCPYCRVQRRLTTREAIIICRLDLAGHTVYEPNGCIYCSGRGFNGRIGLYEMLELNSDWARQIAEGAGEEKILANMREGGVRFLLEDAIDKLLAGTVHTSDVMQLAASW